MSLRRLSIGLLLALVLAAVGMFFWIYARYTAPALANVEKRIFFAQKQTLAEAFKLRHENMLARLRGIGRWGGDSKYLKLSGKEKDEYEATALASPAQPFQDSFDIILIFDSSFSLRFAKAKNRATRKLENAQESLRRWLQREAGEIFADPAAELVVYVNMWGKPGILASTPIVDNESGMYVGRLVGFDYLDLDLLERIGGVYSGEKQILLAENDPRPVEWRKRLDRDGWVLLLDSEDAYSLIYMPKEFNGDRSFAIVVQGRRDFNLAMDKIYHRQLLLFAVIIGVFALLVALFVVMAVETPAKRLVLDATRLKESEGASVCKPATRLEPLRSVGKALAFLGAELGHAKAAKNAIVADRQRHDKFLDVLRGVIDIFLSDGTDSAFRAEKLLAETFRVNFVYCYGLMADGKLRTVGLHVSPEVRSSNKVDLLGEKVDWVMRLMAEPEPLTFLRGQKVQPAYERLTFLLREYDLAQLFCLPLKAKGDRHPGLMLVGKAVKFEKT